MTVEIRVTGQDGSYKHYVVAREPVADPESWMGIEWDPGEGGPAAVRVHPEEVFTGEQAAPVFRAYVVDGRLPAPRHMSTNAATMTSVRTATPCSQVATPTR